ncbi:UDP-N-acetylglucosamine transferase subunit ALG13 homolog [Copidosoma floridanum]|uniref:UDP-N-acetylglucosamine transferase subunit ALG13 homolog n=1 Tax=Copidosoma floridanum TaxID=29053 RepID=UPI0006C99A53|nr:UDP-N-acetylglucosamine transferase subunit ALG13 homolog [Copidosoma floridanum]
MNYNMPRKKIFVTVGTTKFDDLIKTITTDEVLQELSKKGYSEMIMQIGRSHVEPDCTKRCGFHRIEVFNLKPSLQEDMQTADLIISHAGAGSCLEALELSKPLIVVTNDRLMDNHQLELAEQLYKDGHLLYTNCKGLTQLIRSMNLSELKPFTGDKSKTIANTINEIMGFA